MRRDEDPAIVRPLSRGSSPFSSRRSVRPIPIFKERSAPVERADGFCRTSTLADCGARIKLAWRTVFAQLPRAPGEAWAWA